MAAPIIAAGVAAIAKYIIKNGMKLAVKKYGVKAAQEGRKFADKITPTKTKTEPALVGFPKAASLPIAYALPRSVGKIGAKRGKNIHVRLPDNTIARPARNICDVSNRNGPKMGTNDSPIRDSIFCEVIDERANGQEKTDRLFFFVFYGNFFIKALNILFWKKV